MMISWPILVLYVLAIALLFFIVSWTTYRLVTKAWLCDKCQLRIASIKIPPMRFLSSRRLEVLGDNSDLLDSTVCSNCWEDGLNHIDFPEAGRTWWFGATVEYVKNTPAFIALALSLVSLLLGILNFLDS